MRRPLSRQPMVAVETPASGGGEPRRRQMPSAGTPALVMAWTSVQLTKLPIPQRSLPAGDPFRAIREFVIGGSLHGFEQRGDGQAGVVEFPDYVHLVRPSLEGIAETNVAHGAVSYRHGSVPAVAFGHECPAQPQFFGNWRGAECRQGYFSRIPGRLIQAQICAISVPTPAV